MTTCVQDTIGCDYDGTIADTGAIKAAWIEEHLSLVVPPWKTDRTLCVPIIGLENYEHMSQEVYSWQASIKAEEVPGVAAAIAALAGRYRIYIVTARNADQIATSRAWLAQRGLASHIQGFLSSAARNPDGSRVSKGQLCQDHGIRILIDDDERHLRDVEVPGLRRILLKNGGEEPAHLSAGIELATSWAQVLQLLGCKGDG